MPGAFAHITLVNMLSDPQKLEAIPEFPHEAIRCVLKHFKFTELGAVSPDYPYLSVTDGKSAKWADSMHYLHTGQMIHAGIDELKNLSGIAKEKGLAWLLGYAAHVATDVTIHPVVELKVGSYAENKKNHRICEMNQDAYIFQRLNLGQIGLSEHLESGIWACSQEGTDLLDEHVRQLWGKMLKSIYPEEFLANPPAIDNWHKSFNLMVNKIGEEGEKLMPIARHVAVNCGLTYPDASEIDDQYISGLKVPGGVMDYDQIFNRAIENVKHVWMLISKGVLSDSQDYKDIIVSWNLDTGRDQNGKLVFWA